MKNNNLDYTDIEEVKVTAFAQAYDILFDPTKYRPESRETADHSLPYCMAAAIVDKKITTESFSDEKLKDPRIFEVIDKINTPDLFFRELDFSYFRFVLEKVEINWEEIDYFAFALQDHGVAPVGASDRVFRFELFLSFLEIFLLLRVS